jgi:hypothetical protein
MPSHDSDPGDDHVDRRPDGAADTDAGRPRGPTRRQLLAGGGAAVTAALAGCAFGTGPLRTERTSLTVPIGEGAQLRVANENGDVSVEPTDGEDVTVEAVKRTRGPADRFDRVRVTDRTADGALVVETRYDGAFGAGQVSVDLTVGLPSGHALERARTGNGDVEARDVPGDPTVQSANGDVVVRNVDGYPRLETANGDAEATGTTGLAGARSANGDVEVAVRGLREDITCSAGNGDVDVGVPAALDAEVRLTVGNGDVEVDGVTLQAQSTTDSRITGRLGDGGPRLTCESGNGDVRLYGL